MYLQLVCIILYFTHKAIFDRTNIAQSLFCKCFSMAFFLILALSL